MTEVPQPDVVVVCNDPSHEGKTVKVANFTYCDITKVLPDVYGNAPSYTEWWFDLPATLDGEGYEPPAPVPDQWSQAYLRRIYVKMTLVGDVEAGTRDHHQQADTRDRYSMRCDLCGLHVVAREENVHPVLDKLAAHNVGSIELAHLAAIVG